MEFENERVLKLIFPNGVPEDLAENPDLLAYLIKLGSYKVVQLRKEESRLSEEIRTVVEQTQDLAITNYQTFILTSECSREIYRDFKETEKKLGDLVQDLPSFSSVCEEFITKSAEINAARRLNTMTLKKHSQLLDILELPQQMDNFIKTGKYENALDLASYVQRLGSKHGQIPVIQDIVKSIEGSWHTMLVQLLAQLKTDLQLPKCLQVIGYLRRMQAFSNQELKLKFLQARDCWLNNLLAAIPNSDPQQHLSKTIEVTRINVFNIITQYKAIFGDDDQNRVKDGAGNKIFYGWLHQRVSHFLKTLESDLSRGISLDTVLGQCMYFGLSLSRVGADFRGLMAPIFIKTISQQFSNLISTATKKFHSEMENFTLINKMAGLSRSKQQQGDHSDSLGPPESLLDFRPLANYCNAILNAFNELRLCAPVAIANSVTRVLENSLQVIALAICSFHRQEQQAFRYNESENFVRMCTCFVYDMIPYLQRCIHSLFPVQSIVAQLGVNVTILQKEGLTYLDQKAIIAPIEHLLPSAAESVIKVEGKEKDSEETTNASVFSQPDIEVQ